MDNGTEGYCGEAGQRMKSWQLGYISFLFHVPHVYSEMCDLGDRILRGMMNII